MQIIIILNFLAIIAGLVFWIIESGRRKKTEKEIFREIKNVISIAQADVDTLERICNFLQKSHKFHRWLIDRNAKAISEQEMNFTKFGEFIAMLAESIPMNSQEEMNSHQMRIESMISNFWKRSKNPVDIKRVSI